MRLDPATRGVVVVVLTCGLCLAGTSPSAAQTATDIPPAPPRELRTDPAGPVAAQFPATPAADAPGLRFRIEPGFAAGVPVGTFGENVGASFGGAVDFSVRLGDSPVSVGAAFASLRYGTDARQVALPTTVPEAVTVAKTSNSVFWTHALVRVQPRTGRVRPYADGLLGFSYAYTSTVVSNVNAGDSVFLTHGRVGFHPDVLLGFSYAYDINLGPGAELTTHLGDFAPSLGGGGGVTVLLVTGREAALSLDLGVRYLVTGDVSYLRKGAIHRDESGVTFEAVRSPVNVVSPQIGVALEF